MSSSTINRARRDESSDALPEKAFGKADKKTAKHDDWWAFAVDGHGLLPENSRAIFDRIADDPHIKKIILSRTTPIELAGVNTVTEPLQSAAGRDYLLGAGVIFVAERPQQTLGVKVSLDLHHVISVRRGSHFLKHGRTAEASHHPGPLPPPTIGRLPMLHSAPKPAVTAVLTASDVDHVAEIAANWPARHLDGWRTGIPLHDHLLGHDLPADLSGQEQRLREQLAGRRLLLSMPVRRPADVAPRPMLDSADTRRLVQWAEANDVAFGVRLPRGHVASSAASGDDPWLLDVSGDEYESTSVVLRCTDALLTDCHGAALDFTQTGRPVVGFARHLDDFAHQLQFRYDHMFPGAVCHDVDSLLAALESIFEPPSGAALRQYERVRNLLFDYRDGLNANRVMVRLRELLDGRRD